MSAEAFRQSEHEPTNRNVVIDLTAQEAQVRPLNHFHEGIAQLNVDLDRVTSAPDVDSKLYNIPLGYNDEEGEYHEFKPSDRVEFINTVKRANGIKDSVTANVQDDPSGKQRHIFEYGRHQGVPVTFKITKALDNGKVGDVLSFWFQRTKQTT